MRFQIAVATAILASSVVASPYRHQQTNPQSPSYPLASDPTHDAKDAAATDLDDCDEGDKWTTKWTVDIMDPSDGSHPDFHHHYHNKPSEIPQPQPTTPKYTAHVPVRRPTYQPVHSPATPQKPAAPQKPASPSSPTSSDDFVQSVLDRHNSLRAKHQAPPLVWDQKLADYAAGVCGTCVFQHSHGPYGENLYAGSNVSNAADAVQSWYDEVDKYNWSNPGFSMEAGHFTQVIWKSTTKVGCYLKTDCSGMSFGPYFFTCNYEVAGNMMGSFPENVLAG